MGVNCSSIDQLKSNEELSRFSGEEDLFVEDNFWTSFLSFRLPIAFTRSNSKNLEECCSIYLQQLEANNSKTNNYGTLIETFIRLATAIREQNNDELLLLQASNALFILRVITRYFIEINSERNLCHYFIPADDSFQRISLMCVFIDNLYRSAIIIPVQENSYGFHLEIFNTILSLLSIRMCADEANLITTIFSIFMHRLDRLLISEFIRTLIEHFIRQVDCPSSFADFSDDSTINENGSLLKLGQTVASGFWSVFTFGLISSDSQKKNSNSLEFLIDLRRRHLANQSLHILLVLSNHFTHELNRNPYRLALVNFTDTKETSNSPVEHQLIPVFSVNFRFLFEVFCQTVQSEQSTLLLYTIVYRNESFKGYLISRSDVDRLILPMLQVIHQSSEESSRHIYMLLIILLILSEDDEFNQKIQQFKMMKINWYNERLAIGLNLSDLLVSIILRSIYHSLNKSNDKFLHSNCLAALGNMSSHLENLHSFVCQRMISLFNLLSRKHVKICEKIEEDNFSKELVEEQSMLEDVLRMILEIIDSCLTNKLQKNVNLIYALIYDREIFDQHHNHSLFHDVLRNIEIVINFFSGKITELQQRSADYVRQIIEKNIVTFPFDQIRKSTELKFKYVEEEQPEDFFVPYVWSLVYKSSHLYWSSEPSLVSKQISIN